MSDTPRTDAAEYRQPDTDPAEPLGMVDVEFARQIERELNATNERVERLEEDKDILTIANSQVRRIAMERDEADRRVGELEASNDNLTSKATAWKMYADRLEEAGSALRTAAAVFRLKEIEDIYDRFVLMEDLLKDTSILYDDPPTSGDHIALSEAMHNWSTSLSSSKRKAVLSVIQQAGIEIK